MSLAITVESFQCKGIFSDRRFPRGLARAGMFTLTEAQLLERHGRAYQALSEGTQAPQDETEQHFVQVAHGEAEPQSMHEKVWLKYQKSLTRRSYCLTSSNRQDAEESRYQSEPLDLD
ncbi:DUF413 domain-containing protein [Ferrimonas marina]|uniref:Macrodomain Ori protein n=1 Tax=Ferrimonas marina TaxID=299255 RepID=A0A1M5MYY2_9GAMM|nr:DUF413 domain-containing protein [Ferrimonas marina]SHG82139.1 hypothetical protein SAMN02745129_0825 [Ferrimonas marina]